MSLSMMTADGFVPLVREKPRRGRNELLSHGGETRTLQEWSERTGIPYRVIRSRMQCGMPPDRILAKGSLASHGAMRKRYAYGGIERTAQEWSAALGISIHTFRMRLRRGLTGGELFCKSKKPRRLPLQRGI